MELAHLESVHLSFFFNSAVNKLMIDKMQNIISLIDEHSGFIEYSLNKIDSII